MRFAALTVLLLASAASSRTTELHAQYAADQARSLTGLRQVCTNFGAATSNIDAARFARVVENATLELRKSGLRILDCPPEGMGQQRNLGNDGLLNLTVEAQDASLSSDGIRVRMDVEQNVTVQRTGERLRLVTWYHEAEARPTTWESVIDDFALEQVNRFLSDWLAANGR